jgi:hypothetical protein
VPRRNDRLATPRMKAVPDRNLTRLVVGIMSLLRRRPGLSSAVVRPRLSSSVD